MTSFADVVQAHEKHLFDIDRKAAPPPGNNRCQIEAGFNGTLEEGSVTNPWRPPCNVTPRFLMVSLDAQAVDPVTFEAQVEGRTIFEATVEAGNQFVRVEADGPLGFGAAETMVIALTEPGSGYNAGTVAVLVDCPSQWFLSGTLVFGPPPEEFIEVFWEEPPG